MEADRVTRTVRIVGTKFERIRDWYQIFGHVGTRLAIRLKFDSALRVPRYTVDSGADPNSPLRATQIRAESERKSNVASGATKISVRRSTYVRAIVCSFQVYTFLIRNSRLNAFGGKNEQ